MIPSHASPTAHDMMKRPARQMPSKRDDGCQRPRQHLNTRAGPISNYLPRLAPQQPRGDLPPPHQNDEETRPVSFIIQATALPAAAI